MCMLYGVNCIIIFISYSVIICNDRAKGGYLEKKIGDLSKNIIGICIII